MTTSSTQHKYRLRVTAGGDYTRKTQKPVFVNSEPTRIDSDRATIDIVVRIQDYDGTGSNPPSQTPQDNQKTDRTTQVSLRIPPQQATISKTTSTPKTNTPFPSPSPPKKT